MSNKNTFILDTIDMFQYYSNSTTLLPEVNEVKNDKDFVTEDFIEISQISNYILNKEIYLGSFFKDKPEKYTIDSISFENKMSKLICSKEIDIDYINKLKLLKKSTLIEITKKSPTKEQNTYRAFVVYDTPENIISDNNTYRYVLGADVYQNN